jgi:phosphatidate cytidylyltransferase
VPLRVLGIIAGAGFLLIPEQYLWLFATGVVLLLLGLALTTPTLNAGVNEAMVAGFGLLYVFGPWRAGIALQALSPWWLLFSLAVNWVGDTCAYYVGRAIGSTRMAPVISPGKSWEGAIASAVAAVIFAVLFLPRMIPDVTPLDAVLLSIAANIAGQMGDLAESALKRSVGAKDSGTMLPGHGGMLDRVDSAMFSMPVVYGLLLALGL